MISDRAPSDYLDDIRKTQAFRSMPYWRRIACRPVQPHRVDDYDCVGEIADHRHAGMAGCCARAAGAQETHDNAAAPPSSVMNWRRLIPKPIMMRPPEASAECLRLCD
jgi:hypothetical protein